MKYRHYAPDSPLVLLDGEPRAMVEQARQVFRRIHAEGKRVGVLGSQEMLAELSSGDGDPDFRFSLGSRENLEQIAANLYQALRRTDEERLDLVLVETFPERGIGAAVMNRLRRAARSVEDNGIIG